MARNKVNKIIGTKKLVNDQKSRMTEAVKICPYEEKKYFECEIQDCPEENE